MRQEVGGVGDLLVARPLWRITHEICPWRVILSGRFCALVISKSSLLYRSKRPSFLICPSILHRRGAGPWLSPALSLFTSALPCPAFSDQFAVELVNIFPAECGGWTTSWPKACA